MKFERKQFNTFINELREKWKCSMEGFSVKKLCEGLCTSRALWYLEQGERGMDRLFQECILERLGIGAEDYEHFLGYVEYDRWEARQRILHCITFEQTERAEQLLEEYRVTYVKKSKLERQFYLSMLAQIRRCLGASREELSELFEETVRLTVPSLEKKPLAGLVLSVKELNLILEAEQYRKEGERTERYLEIVKYLEGNKLDGRSMAKIYPKVIYFLCRSIREKKEGWPADRLLYFLDRAVEILRNNERLYFLWEILDMQEQLVNDLAERFISQGESGKAEGLRMMYKENAEWKQVLEKTYEEFHVPKETFEYCYLYVVKGVFCSNDVIRIRREMLGMTQRELCENICDTKTLRRLERRQTVPQTEVVERLFERLGLSMELSRTELVTDSPDARVLMEKMKYNVNKECWDEADKLREEICSLIPMEIPSNKQVMMGYEVMSRWKRGEFGNEEYVERMQSVLEFTLPFEAFLRQGEKYVTNAEQTCIQNMMQVMDEKSDVLLACMNRFEEIYQPYIENELQEAVSSMYEYVIGNVESKWGNLGEFEKSNSYNAIIMQGCLRFRRLAVIYKSLYDRWWNCTKQKSENIPTDKTMNDIDELTRCILFSRLGKQNIREQFYLEKLRKATMEN